MIVSRRMTLMIMHDAFGTITLNNLQYVQLLLRIDFASNVQDDTQKK